MKKTIIILGISAFYHDSAAALVKDGEIIAAAQEERFTRKKHDFSFPSYAISYCLKEAGISSEELSYVVFYDKPFLKFERILLTYLTYAPKGLRSFLKAMPLWLKDKLFLKELIKKEINFSGEILFSGHHESHAAAAFYPSPFLKAAILTMDGVGEWATASYGQGAGNRVQLESEIRFPHSLGLLYSAFTYYTGFRVNSGEYKLMGLAPYGEPRYADLIKKELIDLKQNGSFKLNMKYFNYCAGLTMTNGRFHRLFGGTPRKKESEITQKMMDLAASIQAVTEEVMLKMADHVHRATGQDNLCLSGGVALNCVGNGKILKRSPFKRIWIQPAAGDAGSALGAALLVWYQYLNKPRETKGENDFQKGSYLGPSFCDDEILSFAQRNHLVYDILKPQDIARKTAELIAGQNVVGFFQGRMEFGPRALGGRSILGDARSPKMQSIINLKIKFRESFRPFAPSVLEDQASDYFDLDTTSPYMLLVADVKEERIKASSKTAQAAGIHKLRIERSDIPAVTHVDYSARIQTVSKKTNPLYYDVIKEFSKLTGTAVIINTSFNIRGEPIVCTPEDAYRTFMCTDMDYLIMGNLCFEKIKQPNRDQYHKDQISTILD